MSSSRKLQKTFHAAIRRLYRNPEREVYQDQCRNAWCEGVSEVYVRKQVRQLLSSRVLFRQMAGVYIAGIHNSAYRHFDEGIFEILRGKVKTNTPPKLLACILHEFKCCTEIEEDILHDFSWILLHPSAHVRYEFVQALLGRKTSLTESYLLQLMKDPAPKVRDWATFAVGTYNEMDSEAIRNALIENADDSDEDVRHEAICGMARLKMPEVSAFIIREIENYTESNLIYESMAVFPQAEYYEVLKPLMDDKCGSDRGNGKICKCCLAKMDAWQAVNELMKGSGKTCVVQKSTGE